MRKTLTLLISAGAIGAAIAGCGSSSSSASAGPKAAGVQLAPSSGSTTESVTTASSTATTPTTPTTPTVPTPSSGPLSKEPTVAAGKGAQPTKLSTKDLVPGKGPTAKAGDSITVNYVGVLYKNGKVFDSSWQRKQTTTFTLSNGSVIPGWVKGIPGMKVGGRRELIIPASLAYKSAGQGPIPPNSALIFDVDLLKVSKP
jgi:FKBP-type peptidyl-prolyl cis-trans isomerase